MPKCILAKFLHKTYLGTQIQIKAIYIYTYLQDLNEVKKRFVPKSVGKGFKTILKTSQM